MILSEEHEDLIHWAKWCRHNDRPQLWYPDKWALPNVIREWHEDGEKLDRELEDMELRAYDTGRALATDAFLSSWLDRYRRQGDLVAKRHFRVLRAAYYLRMAVGELDVREALRALKDLKDAQERRAA